VSPAPLDASSLDADDILDEAARTTGHPVPQDAPWLPALRLLAGSARAEGGLHEAGAAALRTKLVGLVEERLRAERLLIEHPEIRDRPVPVRFAVAGLARSGTTFLHRLLSCDPDVTFLPTWQAFHPVPSLDHVPSADDDGRRAATVARIEAIRAADPDALRIHPLDADAPEEEVFLLQHSFASMLFAIPCPLPGYVAWLNATDHEDAYRFAFDLIRLNEWALGIPPGRPRVMKSPQFVLDLEVVARLLPATVVVQTHRDPVDLVGSYCSTYEASRRRACRSVDPVALGRERLGQLAAMADRALAVRESAAAHGDGGRFVDVDYARLVAEPLTVVEEVYAAAGLDLTDAARRAMTAWLDANPQHKTGRHDYDLARYGLDRSTVQAALAPYLERHRPEVEP
jgi:hypothetical protein